MDTALICQNVTKIFRVKSPKSVKNGSNGYKSTLLNLLKKGRKDFYAVDDVSFSVRKGEIFGIIGENGSGKSTLIRMVSTLLFPSKGYISVFGHDVIRDYHAVRMMINRVSAEAAFFKKLSAHENLLFAGRLYGENRKSVEKNAAAILERVNFPLSKINVSMEDLSRGMQQKIAIARALLTSPILLLLDEPTTGLDPRSKQEVQKFVQEIQQNHNATVIITTHDMKEAGNLCNRIAIINDGKIVALDTPENLKKRVSSDKYNSITLEEVFLKLTGRRYKDDEHNDSS